MNTKIAFNWLVTMVVYALLATPALGQDKGETARMAVLGLSATAPADLDAGSQLALAERYLNAEREQFPNGISHYKFEVRLGPREYDVVRIHRVVREHRPYKPVRTRGGVFMTHGANLNFESIFLRTGAENPGVNTSVALYLAGKGVDVWGIDLGWTRVPADATDFSFMEDWGVERDAGHTLAAMSIARIIRGLSGQSFDRMHLMGYSYGVAVIYAAAGRETLKPRYWRHIRGLIPVDGAMKYSGENEASRLNVCSEKARIAAAIDSGVLQDSGGLTAGFLSSLATAAPDDPSPVFPGLSNYQAPLFFGTNTYVLLTPRAPFWHFVGGEFDASGLPSGLRYGDADRWIRFLGTIAPHMPNRARFETAATVCDEDDLTIDDYLTQITVPILYVGAGGAFGDYGDHTGSITASSDVTNYTVQLQPEDQRTIDYGHADLFLADDADALVWEVMRKWIVSR